jgi:hypothetical protein
LKIKLHIASYILILVAAAFMLALLALPVSSISNDLCSRPGCHSNYHQQLDLLEGNSQNVFPTSLQVGQTATVTVVIENINNSPIYSQLTNTRVTLSSQNNHFSVNQATYTIGNLPTGTATATFQITGTSGGSDQLAISANAYNSHKMTFFQDTFSPSPSITVVGSGASTTPTPTAEPTLTQNPTSTANPSTTSTPNPTPTSAASQNPSTTPTPTTSASNTPSTTPNVSTSPTQTPTPNPTPPTSGHSSQLDSNMLYIHPPLSIAGYVFILLFTATVIKKGVSKVKVARFLGLVAWVLTALGLLTGMLWAQLAWGSYWSWDIKETLTLALFLSLSAGQVAYFERKPQAAKWLLTITCVLVIVTASTSFILTGLHSYL